MGKTILKVVGVLVALFAAYVLWAVLYGNKRSPQETVAHAATDTQVTYCRPYKKGRVIFGELVPYGEYWRLGANEATEIVFAKDVRFGDKDVKAGTYRLYAVPEKDKWKVVLNSELGWGASEPDHKKDVATVEVPVQKVEPALEQFTIAFAENELDMAWDTTRVRVPLALR